MNVVKNTFSSEKIAVKKLKRFKSFKKFIGKMLFFNNDFAELLDISPKENLFSFTIQDHKPDSLHHKSSVTFDLDIDSHFILKLFNGELLYKDSEIIEVSIDSKDISDSKDSTPVLNLPQNSNKSQDKNLESAQKLDNKDDTEKGSPATGLPKISDLKDDTVFFPEVDYRKSSKQIFSFDTFKELKNSYFEINGKDEREEIIYSIMQNGVLFDGVFVAYDLKVNQFVSINRTSQSEESLKYWSKKEGTLFYAKDLLSMPISYSHLERVPAIQTVYEPKKSFGLIQNSKRDTSFNMFNIHNEPDFNPNVAPNMAEPISKLLFNLFENEDGVDFALNWFANLVQRNKNETTIILTGTQGSGKGTILLLLSKIIGDDNSMELGNTSLENGYNDDLANRRLIAFNEISDHSRSQSISNKIKSYTTESVLPIYARYQSTYKAKNFASYLIFSNAVDILRIAFDDRRLSLFRQSSKLSDELSSSIYALSDLEISQFKRFLLDRNISEWNSRAPFNNATRNRAMMNTNTKKDVLIHLIQNSWKNNLTQSLIDECEMKDIPILPQGKDEIVRIIEEIFEEFSNEIDSNSPVMGDYRPKEPEFGGLTLKGLGYATMEFNEFQDAVKKDCSILFSKRELVSSLATLLYRVWVDNHKASTTIIGRFFAKYFGKSRTVRLKDEPKPVRSFFVGESL